MDVNKQILLVGTEPSLGPESLTLFSPLKDQWTISYVGNGTQAVELLEKIRFQAVISDLRLPDMSGNQLLDQVIQRDPSVHRFFLADLTDRQTMLKCVGTAHQFLSKPCDSTKLEAALNRAFRMEVLFGNDVVKQMVTQMRKVPSPPTIYFQIVKELHSPSASMENIGVLISQDTVVTEKLLQMVNSAAFGLQRPVSSPAEAVTYLGIETTKSLVLLAHTYSHFERIPPSIFSVDGLWRHSLAVGRLARAIARAERCGEEAADQSFTAGLLHDMGKLVLAANQPEAYGRVNTETRRSAVALWEAESRALGATHAEVGAWLAAIWGLPIPIIEALALHHHPSRFHSEGFSPLSAVHAGNAIEHELQADGAEPVVARLDLGYLARQGWAERIEPWRELGRNLAPHPNSITDTERRMAA